MKLDFTLEIKSIENKNKFVHPKVPHEVLPQHEFSMLIVAPKGSGKTNLICNLIMNQYKGYFHDIVVISPTVHNDDKWEIVQDTPNILKENKRLKKILNDEVSDTNVPQVVFDNENVLLKQKDKHKFDGKIKEDSFYPEIDDLFPILQIQHEEIQMLAKKYGESKAKMLADRMLVILDDQAGNFQGGQRSAIGGYVMRHRHYSSSVIIVTQAYKAIPKTVRTNVNAIILFEIGNRKEVQVIYEEYADRLDEETWMSLFRHATDDPFAFMYYNTQFPRNNRFFKNFTHAISEDGDIEILNEKQEMGRESTVIPKEIGESEDEDEIHNRKRPQAEDLK